MEKLIKQTKHKPIVLTSDNLNVIADKPADLLQIAMLKQVTITFVFPDKQSAQDFFDQFKEGTAHDR